MPDRRIHITHAIKLIKLYNLDTTIEAASLIETLIDHPKRLPRLLKEKLYRECKLPPIAEAARVGLRARGIMAHDWRSPLGRRVLERIVECLFGRDAILLVHLHHALDDLWEGRVPHGYDERVMLYVSSLVEQQAVPGIRF